MLSSDGWLGEKIKEKRKEGEGLEGSLAGDVKCRKDRGMQGWAGMAAGRETLV